MIQDVHPRGEKLGLVWINRKKISQIINDYIYLPFFLLIILWSAGRFTVGRGGGDDGVDNWIIYVSLRSY
jgi:hypothetical protein